MGSTIPELPVRSPQSAASRQEYAQERASRVEAHGIDIIPDEERRGRARSLFFVWAAPNVNYLCIVLGGALMLMGLSLWQAAAVALAGNLFWALPGLVAVSGPAAGAPSEVIMRTMFGVRGNRVNIAISGWLVDVCYLALSWSAAALAAFDLLGEAGVQPDTALKVAVIVLIAVATLAISVYGHAMILRLYLPFTIALAAVLLVVSAYVLDRADWGYRPAQPLHGTLLWSALAGGTTLIASGPLSFNNSADFSRYLARDTSPTAVALWTAFGAIIPNVLLTVIGALAGTALDMTDPQSALSAILPGWFRPAFLLAIILAALANNAMTAYSSGLALLAVGVRIRRSRSVAFDGTLGVALTLYALLVSNFLNTVNNMLELGVALLGPAIAIYSVDILIRHNRYHGPDLVDETPESPYWFRGGINWAGAATLVLATVAASLCLNTTLYEGPVARALGGVDISLPTGILLGGAGYWALTRAVRTSNK